jgi:hypothetical protein
MDVTNKTKKPLSLPLPGGKKLFLGPGKTGQVSPKALKHPPLAALIEAGDVATADSDFKPKATGGGGKTPPSGAGGPKSTGAMRQSGDR